MNNPNDPQDPALSRSLPLNAPPGSTPGAAHQNTSLNRNPTDPSQPQIPADAAATTGLANVDHPLAPPAKSALESHADLGSDIDRLRDQVREWWTGFQHHEGSAAADVKGKLAELATFLDQHKSRYFPPR